MGRWRKGTWQMVLRNMSKEDMWGLLFEMAEKNQVLQEKLKQTFPQASILIPTWFTMIDL